MTLFKASDGYLESSMNTLIKKEKFRNVKIQIIISDKEIPI